MPNTQIQKYKNTNTQIQHMTKCQKDPTCGIFLKRGFSEPYMYHLCIVSMHHQRIISASSAHHQRIISASSVHHQCIINASSVHHKCIISASSAHYQCIISASSAHHQYIISGSYGSSLNVSTGPHLDPEFYTVYYI